jgi:hypothetical protein
MASMVEVGWGRSLAGIKVPTLHKPKGGATSFLSPFTLPIGRVSQL